MIFYDIPEKIVKKGNHFVKTYEYFGGWRIIFGFFRIPSDIFGYFRNFHDSPHLYPRIVQHLHREGPSSREGRMIREMLALEA